MFKEILKLILRELEDNRKKDTVVDHRIVQLIEEINELEVKHVKALAEVERWGDISDTSNWRTVEYNKIGRIIEAKKRMLKELRQDF